MSIEHTFGDYLFRAAYIGYEIYHLPVQEQLSPGLFATGGQTTLLPNFSNVQGYVSWNTQSYNALQFSAEKHFSRGFQFISNFTWSKNLDSSSVATAANTGPVFDPYNLRNNRGLSDLSVPAIFNNTFIYQEPSLEEPRTSRIVCPGRLGSGWNLGDEFRPSVQHLREAVATTTPIPISATTEPTSFRGRLSTSTRDR